MANRHLSRSVVMQSLFEWDFNGRKDNDIKPVLARNAEEFAPGLSDFSFINTLAESILKKVPELDIIIEKAAPEWPIEKISIVDRNILRLGLYELLFSDREEVPAKVAINEAIELAKTFGGENSGKFVNGVLGSVYKELGEPGKDNVSKPKNKNIDLKNLPVEKLGGAVVYGRSGDDIYLALVHDIFGHWTLSKGHYLDNETDQEAVVRIIKKEIGLPLKSVGEELGRNEYIASDPDKGKIKKQVVYYLAEAPYQEIPFEKSGGLDDARWFKLTEILDLNFYNDILPIVTKAVNGLLGNK